MKPLSRRLLAFSLAAAGIILATVLRIYVDYYKAVTASHPKHPTAFPHTLGWLLPYVFVLSVVIGLMALFLLVQLPYNWQDPSRILAGIGLVALAFQPITWSLHDRLYYLFS